MASAAITPENDELVVVNPTPGSKARALWVLLLVSLLSALNYYDRNLITVLVEALRKDLGLSDSQIGLLSGLAFAAVASLFSLPIAKYADGGRRARVLGLSGIFWSLMTGLCGVAAGFGTLLVARIGVGLGEAGAAPTMHAIVAETFSPKRRAIALSSIAIFGAFGLIASLSLGGYIATAHGWRAAFYTATLPGLVVSGLLLLTVRDSRMSRGSAAIARPVVGGAEAWAILKRRRAFVLMCIGMSLAGIGAYGAAQWLPAYFMRQFHLTPAQIGGSYTAMVGVASLVGIVLGGVVGDLLSKRDARAPFYILGICFALTGPINIFVLLSNSYDTAVSLAFPSTLIATLWIAPAYAAIQALSGPKLRAVGASIFMLTQGLIGQGLGPSIVGVLSDLLKPSFGAESLRYALIIAISTYVIGAIFFFAAARTARQDIAEANAK